MEKEIKGIFLSKKVKLTKTIENDWKNERQRNRKRKKNIWKKWTTKRRNTATITERENKNYKKKEVFVFPHFGVLHCLSAFQGGTLTTHPAPFKAKVPVVRC